MKPETLAGVWDLIGEHFTAVYWSRDHEVDRIRAEINAILSRHEERAEETEEQAAEKLWRLDSDAAAEALRLAKETDNAD